MNQPLIAIIVPVYKVEQYLRRCLDSILAQTYKNFEVILVDDGSPDQCGEICDEYARKDARFTVIHQENKGLSGARNSGIEKCLSEKKAQYIFFVDSDDYIAKNALELLVKETRDCNFDIIMGGYSEVWQDNTVQYSSLNWQKKADVQEICMDILCNNLPNFAWGKLYKTILWEKIRFPDGVNMEDMYTIPKVFYKARSACVLPASVYFYSHENEKSILNNIELTHYVQLRYDWFLAWVEHEVLAQKYAPEYQIKCIVEAMHKAVRAGLMNQFVNILSAEQYGTIISYLRSHENISVKRGLHAGRYLLLHGNAFLLKIVGRVQCWITVKRMESHRRRNK